MSYLDLDANERQVFLALQKAGLRSMQNLGERKRDWPKNARTAYIQRAKELARGLTPQERIIIGKVWQCLTLPR